MAYSLEVVDLTKLPPAADVLCEKELDFSQSYMLYAVVEDEENNPVVMYIENDYEYAVAAQYFSRELSKKYFIKIKKIYVGFGIFTVHNDSFWILSRNI